MKTLIVGQAPARSTAGLPPFSGRSGARFAGLLGVEHARLCVVFDVVNLIGRFPGSARRGDLFPMREARRRARALRRAGLPVRVVLVGKNVARAFGLASPRFFEWLGDPEGTSRFCVVPHPSGISHFWNEPGNVEEARRFMRAIPRGRTRT